LFFTATAHTAPYTLSLHDALPISTFTRRQMIRSLVSGSIILPGIVSELLALEARGADETNPLTPRAPHFPGKAKRVIFMCMSGRSEEHTSELQSLAYLVCRLLLEK